VALARSPKSPDLGNIGHSLISGRIPLSPGFAAANAEIATAKMTAARRPSKTLALVDDFMLATHVVEHQALCSPSIYYK